MMPGFENIGLRWRQIRFNPLRSLTPEKLASALDSHAAGWLREAALIFETIEQREAIVRSVMTKRKAAVARRDWQVVVPDADAPDAEAHKATLEYFYNNITVTDATDLNVRTGMSGLLRQMMDAVIQRYAVHEIVWKPGEGGLTAELRRVPLYFFENRSGKLRFTGPENRADGMELEDDGWMVTVADGLGEALSICWMFKRLGIQDLMAFSEKFSVPGVLGRTSAKKDSDEGNAMRDSVLAYASEWVGLVYGDDGAVKDPISVIQTPSGASMPPMIIAEYFDRMIATLVRGGDLSTISRDNGNGSNPQQDETDTLLEDDCAMVSETLQTQLDRLVIRMVHGDVVPAAYVVINPPSNEDLTKDLLIDEGLARLGVVQDPADLAERYGREIAEEAEGIKVEEEAKRGEAEIAEEDAEKMEAAENAMDAVALSEWLFEIREALATDLQPLGDALAGAMQAGDLPAMQAALRKISNNMPELAGDAEAMTEVLTKQFTEAFTGGEDLAENYDPNQARVPGGEGGGRWTRDGGLKVDNDTHLSLAEDPDANGEKLQGILDASMANIPVHAVEFRQTFGQVEVSVYGEDDHVTPKVVALLSTKADSINIDTVEATEGAKGKGYGKALYLAVARYGQENFKESITGSSSEDAIFVRQSIFPTVTKQQDDLVFSSSLILPEINYTPKSFRQDVDADYNPLPLAKRFSTNQ